MALTIQLRGTRPGHGQLALLGWDASTENLEIAIQRNSDSGHLARNQQWQATEYWHRLDRLECDQGRLSAELGPDIIDAIVAASDVQFKLFVRSEDSANSSVLRTIGRLLGSEAGNGLSDDPEAVLVAVDGSEHRPSGDEAMQKSTGLPASQYTDVLDPSDGQTLQTMKTATGARRFRAVVLILLLLAGAAWGVWFYLRQPHQQMVRVGTEPQPEAPMVTTIEQKVTLAPPPEPAGSARFLRFLQSSPTPILIYARASGWEQEGDCTAAMIAYRQAAEIDAESAFKFAQRYDPDRFVRNGCVAQANSETAAYWYEKPATAGNPEAQRRLGELLVERHTSGPLYRTGKQWLRKAADQGDRRARAILEPEQN